MQSNYWSGVLATRVTRRRGMAFTGGATLSAAFLAACGGGSSSNSSSGGGSKDQSGIVTKPVDTSKDAKRGGILKDKTNADITSMDVQQPLAPLNIPARHVYSTLVRQKAGYLQGTSTDLSPDLAESWELSPDGLQITMKLRANAKWHNNAPVNGRAADSSDVVYSCTRYAASAPLRALVANAANPTAPVLGVSATDAKTVVIKLKEPVNYALNLFASFGSFTGNVIMLPKETEGGYDIRNTMIGTGPYFLSDYQPSVGFTLKRNPDYWDQNANMVDQINQPIVLDYSQVLAQLRAGNLHYLGKSGGLRPEDILALKKDVPALQTYTVDSSTASTVMTFGQLPDGKSPFLDERVRQAFSESWDRKSWIDAFYNVPQLEAGGLPTDVRWNSALPADFSDVWLDPQSKDFGPNAKYYQHDIDDAKKLLAAAGYASGLDVMSNRITTNAITDLARSAEALEGMAQDAGFKIKINAIDYASEYIPKVRDANGQYQGVGFHTVTGTTPWRLHPISALAAEYWSKAGATFKGFSTTGKNDKAGDPAVDAIIEKARLEKDAAKQKGYAQDLQRMLGKSLYGLINPGTSTDFAMAWPALRNFQVYRVDPKGTSAWTHYSVWLDQTKPPFTSA